MSYKIKFKEKKEFLNQYEKTANNYDFNRSSSFEGQQVDKNQINLIKSLIKKNNVKKILEAGCGTGRILLPISKMGIECYGFDPSENMLNEFNKKMKKKNSKIHLKKGDIEKIPFKDNFFDLTYTMHVLMHLPKGYKKAFKEMYRVTKKKGLIVCDFPNKDSIWTKISLLLNPNKKRTQLFKINDLKIFFNKYDYKITGLFSYARSFYNLPGLRRIISFLETHFPLPIIFRTQLIVIVKK